MSMFLNISQGPMGSTGLNVQNNMYGQSADYPALPENGTFWAMAPFSDGVLWPTSRFMAGDLTAPLAPFGTQGGDAAQTGRYAAPRNQESGANSFGRITGNTLDSTGNPLGNCQVNAYISSTNVIEPFVVTSDPGGYYDIPCATIAVTHYIVAYKAAGPDVAGVSVNTIIPTY